METNYIKYRGKCKEECDKLVNQNPERLRIVKGWYHEPLWNTKEEHFWCEDKDGTIIDPTAKQFPSGGVPEFYKEYQGTVECDQCGKVIEEKDIIMQGRFPVCSVICALRLVGLEEYL